MPTLPGFENRAGLATPQPQFAGPNAYGGDAADAIFALGGVVEKLQDAADRAAAVRKTAESTQRWQGIVKKNDDEISDHAEFVEKSKREIQDDYKALIAGASTRKERELIEQNLSDNLIGANVLIDDRGRGKLKDKAIGDYVAAENQLVQSAKISSPENLPAVYRMYGQLVGALRANNFITEGAFQTSTIDFDNKVKSGRSQHFDIDITQQVNIAANEALRNPALADVKAKDVALMIDTAGQYTMIPQDKIGEKKAAAVEAVYANSLIGRITAATNLDELGVVEKELLSGKFDQVLSNPKMLQMDGIVKSHRAELIRLAKEKKDNFEKVVGDLVKDRGKAILNGQVPKLMLGDNEVSEADLSNAVKGTKYEKDYNADTKHFNMMYGLNRLPLTRTTEEPAPTGGKQWATEKDLPKVQQFFKNSFGKDLPISAQGQSQTHDQMGLDHRASVDIAVNPTSKEGMALMDYLDKQNIPFIAFDRAKPGAATGPHIHIGAPSPKKTLSQVDTVVSLRRNPDGSPKKMTGDDAELAAKLQAQVEKNITGFKADPLGYGEQQGLISPLPPLDMKDPNSLKIREQAARALEAHEGFPVPPLRDADAEQIKTDYEKSSLQGKADIIARIAGGFSDDNYTKVGKVLAGKNSSLAMNIELAKRNGINQSVLKQVLQGEEIIKVEGDQVFADRQVVVDAKTAIDRMAQVAYRGAPVYYDAIKKAAVSYLAATLWNTGAGKGAGASNAQIKDALQKVSGGIIGVRGVPTVAPAPGIDTSDFMDMLRWADYRNLAPGFKPDDIVNRNDAKFEYYQEGRYKVRIGPVVVQDKQGRDFVLDLNEGALLNKPGNFRGVRPFIDWESFSSANPAATNTR